MLAIFILLFDNFEIISSKELILSDSKLLYEFIKLFFFKSSFFKLIIILSFIFTFFIKSSIVSFIFP